MDCENFACKGVEFIKLAGSGGNGDVFMASENNDIIAIKQVQEDVNSSYMEYALQKAIDHPYVMPIRKLCANDHYINMVMEYAPMPLSEYILDDYSFNHRLEMLYKLLEGLACIHQHGIIHADFKHENIQLRFNDDGTFDPLIIDFGLAFPVVSMISGRNIGDIRGTPEYLPLETLSTPPNTLYTDKVDVWSFGILALLMFTGTHFFPPDINCSAHRSLCYERLLSLQSNGEYRIVVDYLIKTYGRCNITDEDQSSLVDFITLALKLNPDERPSAHKLLKHDVFNDVSYKSMCNRAITPTWPPSRQSNTTLQRMKQGALEIAQMFLQFRVVDDNTGYIFSAAGINMGIHLFYWTTDLMYLYFSHSDVRLYQFTDTLFYTHLIAFIGIIISADGFFPMPEITNIYIRLLPKPVRKSVTHELVESIKPGIVVTLNGHIWRRFLYESIRTKKDYNESYAILFDPKRYLSFIPTTIDPIREKSPKFMNSMSMTNIQLPK